MATPRLTPLPSRGWRRVERAPTPEELPFQELDAFTRCALP